MSRWFLGTIGFSYKDWVGGFYPPGASQREYLPYYTKFFNSVELDTTFHSAPRIDTVQSWHAATPPEFKFSLKTPRVITHEMGLKGVQGLMSEFLEALPASHRYAVEFRHPSWYNDRTAKLLSQSQVCWVSIDFPHLPKNII